jgi:ribosomal protein S8
MVSSALARLVCNLKLSLSAKKFNCKVPYSKLNIKILTILYNEGYIRGFKVIENEKTIYLFMKYIYNHSIITDCAFFPARNKLNHLKYNQLISLYGFKTFGIVSTDIGLLTLQQCFLYKKGVFFY